MSKALMLAALAVASASLTTAAAALASAEQTTGTATVTAHASRFGAVLFGGSGRTLYLFKRDRGSVVTVRGGWPVSAAKQAVRVAGRCSPERTCGGRSGGPQTLPLRAPFPPQSA
jgi:predicted lipoprotein with Yx(FWY)xxD motif